MRILITNDDGITAPGLDVLTEIATDLAGSTGEVWTVAPALEQSGVGHCINYAKPTMVTKLNERRFSVEGSPADCILAGLHDVMIGTPPDLILSGVNRGNNAAENTLYSGTIGAAIEGALQGYNAIALSQYYGVQNAQAADPFAAARVHGASLIRKLIDHTNWDGAAYRTFLNVNFPPVPAADVKGTQIARQGLRSNTKFGVEPATAPNGRRFLWMRGGPQTEPTGPGTDAQANLDGFISVTPMRADLTADDQLAQLSSAIKA